MMGSICLIPVLFLIGVGGYQLAFHADDGLRPILRRGADVVLVLPWVAALEAWLTMTFVSSGRGFHRPSNVQWLHDVLVLATSVLVAFLVF